MFQNFQSSIYNAIDENFTIFRNDLTCEKNLALPHKPNLGLAAQVLVSKQKYFPEVISEKPNTLAEDCAAIDVEESEDNNNVGVPMFVRHTEAFLDEIDRMV